MLERSGFYQQVSPDTLFLSIDDAVITACKLQHQSAYMSEIDRDDFERKRRSVTAAVHDCGGIATEVTTVRQSDIACACLHDVTGL